MRLKRAVCASNSSQGAAVARACTVKRGATITDLASEFLARMSGSAGAGSSVVVVLRLRIQRGSGGVREI